MQHLKVALVQYSMIWEEAHSNLMLLNEWLTHVSENTHLVVLPEMFATGFTMKPELVAQNQEGSICNFMKKQAKNFAIMGSMAYKEGDSFYNRLWVYCNEQPLTYYDKCHLFAFGKEDKHYRKGVKKISFNLVDCSIQPFICYDLRFPVWCRSNRENHIQIFVANWPEKRIHAWKSLLVARAIENQCYVIGVNRVGVDGNQIAYNGQSMVVDPIGNILLDAKDIEGVFEVELDLWELEKVRRKWPFLNDADQFEIII